MYKCCCLLAGAVAGAVLLAMIGSPPSPAGAVPPGTTVAKATDPAAQPTMATSRVTKVTVYPNSALVSREVVVPPGNGTVELVVAELPEQTMNGSLYSEATEGLRVLSTRFRTRAVKEDTRDEVRKLVDEQKTLMLTGQKLEADIKTSKENLELLTKLEKFTTVTTVSATEKGTLSGDTVITLSKYVMEKRGEKSKELVSLQQELLSNQEQAQFVKRKLDELRSGSSKTERDAVIVVDRHNGGGKLWLNYLVDSVTWKPQYKLRAGKAAEPIQVDYLAAVVQHTGEEWRNVDLTLSTAQPMLSAAPPELKMLEVAVVTRASIPMPSGTAGTITFAPQKDMALDKKANDLRVQARQELYSNNFEINGKLLNSASAWEQGKELMCTKEELLAKQRNPQQPQPGSVDEGPSVTFHLATRLTVPSRKDEQVIEVAKLNLAPKYYYKAVPVLTRHVYRLADLTNKSEHILLPGEATMYQGTDFVGRMTMPLVAIGEDMTVGFGIDPQLQVQRQMLDMAKTTQGGNQVLKYEYRILVNSFKTEPVKLQVWDRLPHAAATETAGVNLLKTTPELSKDGLYLRESRPNNLLRWDLDVEPTMNGERALTIAYEFKLELDRQMLISSFMTK